MIADVARLCASPVVLVDEIENAGVDRRRAVSLLTGSGKIVLMSTHDPMLALLAKRRWSLPEAAWRPSSKRARPKRPPWPKLTAMDVRLTRAPGSPAPGADRDPHGVICMSHDAASDVSLQLPVSRFLATHASRPGRVVRAGVAAVDDPEFLASARAVSGHRHAVGHVRPGRRPVPGRPGHGRDAQGHAAAVLRRLVRGRQRRPACF